MNRYAQVLTASALAYTAQASAAARWARGATMSSPPQFIATAEQLVALTKEPRARHLVVCGNLANVPSFRLAPGQTLTGNGDNASISFAKGVDGLQLSSNNEVRNLRLEASAGQRAIFNDTSVDVWEQFASLGSPPSVRSNSSRATPCAAATWRWTGSTSRPRHSATNRPPARLR